MKRFHVHVAVENLAASVAFYSDLFGAKPTRRAAGLCQVDARRSARQFRDSRAAINLASTTWAFRRKTRRSSRVRRTRELRYRIGDFEAGRGCLLLRQERQVLGRRSPGPGVGELSHFGRSAHLR